MKLRFKILLLLITLLAFALRFYALGLIPASPDWDEAALGYNAYSILRTGRDEYGNFLPLSLRSFDDYKPPFYMYLTVVSVAVFGLSVWSTRLPSAVLGVLAVVCVVYLTRQLIGIMSELQVKRSKRKHEGLSDNGMDGISLLVGLLLSISPWHIQFSRIAFEANLGLCLNIFALTAFFYGFKKRYLIPFSAFLFGLGLYAYHSERVFIPLILLLLFIIFRTRLWSDRKSFFAGIAVGCLMLIPLVMVFLNPATLLRLKGTSALSDQTGLLRRSVFKLQADKDRGDWTGVVFDNRRIVWFVTVLDGYLSHYSLKWWFINGDNPRHHAPDMGMMYLVEMPWLLYGIYRVFRRGGPIRILLFGWFFIAPIAAAPTTELPHGIRSMVFLPVLQIFTAIGLYDFFSIWSGRLGRRLKQVITVVIILMFCANFVYYLVMYFDRYNLEFSEFWQYGYRQVVSYAEANKSKYNSIVVSTKLEQPHMFFLFYTGYDPVRYLAEGGTVSGGFKESNNKFGKYEFRPINWSQESHTRNTLYIGTPDEIMGSPLLTVDYLNGKPAMEIAE